VPKINEKYRVRVKNTWLLFLHIGLLKMFTLMFKEFNLKYFKFFASWKMVWRSVFGKIRLLNIHAAVLFIKICSKLNILENASVTCSYDENHRKTFFKINICSSNTGIACKPPAETTSEHGK
jgi:hypothetical protein